MNILFVIDKIELKYFEFNNLVTNFWIIKELLNRGANVYITTNNRLYLHGSTPLALCYSTYLESGNIFYKKEELDFVVDDFDGVIFRPDPPVDNDYINATYILDFAKKTKVINDTIAIRNFNEKLHTSLFGEYMPEHIVTASMSKIENFLAKCGEIVLKPLNQCFGSGVMYLKEGDFNTRSIINTMTNNENSVVMVQQFIPDVKYGDKRVLTLGDRVLDECVIKLPTTDDFKFNTHNDNFVKKGVLSETEKNNFTKVAKALNERGIYMAGLDVVDEKIIEINVTSPCYFIKEINNNFCTNIETEIVDYILALLCGELSRVKEMASVSGATEDNGYQFRTETF
jgi:glutathione synthase